MIKSQINSEMPIYARCLQYPPSAEPPKEDTDDEPEGPENGKKEHAIVIIGYHVIDDSVAIYFREANADIIHKRMMQVSDVNGSIVAPDGGDNYIFNCGDNRFVQWVGSIYNVMVYEI